MKVRAIILAVVMALTAFLCGLVPLYAAGIPSLPQIFYGTVKINNVDAPAGTIVEGRVDLPQVALNGAFNPIVTSQPGLYGGLPATGAFGVLVQGNIADGTIVHFFVNGVQANESVPFHSGGGLGGPTLLNLTAGAPPPVAAPVAPSVTTNEATSTASPTGTTANINGTLSAMGTAIVVDVSFDWGTTSGGPYPNTTNVQTRTVAVPFAAPLAGLTPNTTYYFRARAFGGGTLLSLGTEKTFTTTLTPPTPTPTPTTTPAPTPPAGGGGGGGGIGGGGGGTAGPTPVIINVWGTPTQYDIGRDGRILTTITANTQDNKIAITLPAGTMALQSTGAGLDRLFINPALAVPPPPPNARIMGGPQTLEPSGATFDPPIVLVWSVDPTQIPVGSAEKDLQMAFYDVAASKWVNVPTTVDTVAHTVTGKIFHFTTFAIIATLPDATPTAAAPTTAPPTTTAKPVQSPVTSPPPGTSAVPAPVTTPPPATTPASSVTVTVSVPMILGGGILIGMVFAVLLVFAFRRRLRP